MSGSDEYKVGYRNTPRENRYKKGQSGNPSGKRKRRPTFDDHLENAMESKVSFTENGRRKKMSRDQLSAMRLANEACQNTRTALTVSRHRKLRNAERRDLYEAETPLPDDDQALIDAYIQRNLSRYLAPSASTEEVSAAEAIGRDDPSTASEKKGAAEAADTSPAEAAE